MSPAPKHRPTGLTPPAVDALLQETTPWLSCEECFERMDTYAQATVFDPHHHDEAMTTHLHACVACDEETRSLIDLLTARSDRTRSSADVDVLAGLLLLGLTPARGTRRLPPTRLANGAQRLRG